MVEYFKVENRILRDKLPKRIPITPREKNRLIKFGKLLGDAVKQIVGIVHPRPSSAGSPRDRPEED